MTFRQGARRTRPRAAPSPSPPRLAATGPVPVPEPRRAPEGDVPFTVRRARLVALLALLAALAAGLLGHDVSRRLSAGSELPPHAEAQRADDLLRGSFHAGAPDLVLLARADGPRGVDGPGAAAEGARLARLPAADGGVTRVRAYWQGHDPALRASDGRSALVLAWLHGDSRRRVDAAARLADRARQDRGPLAVSAGGEAVAGAELARQSARDARTAELIAVPVTLLLLTVVFGSLVAAALPVLVGVLAMLGTLAALRGLTAFTEVSVYALSLATALAFGLALDYSLFLVSRYREERRSGAPVADAVGTMLRTSGRAVAVSAATVACGMSTLLVFPHTMLRSIGYGGLAVTVLAALTSLLVLPAALALLGDRLDRLDPFARWRRTVSRRRLYGGWGRCAAAVMRHPALVAVPLVAVLLLLAAPFAQLRTGTFDERVLPEGNAVRQVHAALRAEFPRATGGAATVVLPGYDAAARPAPLDRYARDLSRVEGVGAVEGVRGRWRDGRRTPVPAAVAAGFRSSGGTWLLVSGGGDPTGPAAAARTVRIRGVPAPGHALVGGPGAVSADVRDPVRERLPAALTLLASAMFVLVLALTRRPVLALKALVLNSLSLCATLGALVYVFQDGHLRWLVGDFTATGATDPLLPVVVLALAFGLSMDYECVLLARVVEEHRRTGDTVRAVVAGVDRTARLFTWAALCLALVMAALAASPLPLLKAVGVGVGLAALLDATLVRALLVPAVMRLAGPANWWKPPALSAPWRRGAGRRRRGPRG